MQFHGNNHKYDDIPVMHQLIWCVPSYIHILDTETDDKTQTGENMVIGEAGSYPNWIIESKIDWWCGTFFIFPYIENSHPNWRSYFSEGFFLNHQPEKNMRSPWDPWYLVTGLPLNASFSSTTVEVHWSLELGRCWCETALAPKTSWRCDVANVRSKMTFWNSKR